MTRDTLDQAYRLAWLSGKRAIWAESGDDVIALHQVERLSCSTIADGCADLAGSELGTAAVFLRRMVHVA